MDTKILVKIIPHSLRAKNRAREHGEVMELIEDRGVKFLVMSLGFTDHGGCWLGWFQTDEATFEHVEGA